MSHFSVMVIGENPEQQLAPYHEFECTGTDDQYVQTVDITSDLQKLMADGKSLKEALEWHGLEDHVVEHELNAQLEGKHKYGYAVVKDGVLLLATQRTNPNAKWDWHALGGRWANHLKLKPGRTGASGKGGVFDKFRDVSKPGYADAARKGEIDWDGMRSEALARGRERYMQYSELVAKYGEPEPWAKFRDELHKDDIEAARDAYHAQRFMKGMFSENNYHERFDAVAWSNDPATEFAGGEDAYATRQANASVCTFAVLKDGVWAERGEMGWWGCVRDEKDAADWQAQFWTAVQALPDDTLISIYDCHI